MNKEHLKAILDSNGPALVAKCGGRIIASDGQIAVAADYPISGKREKMEEFAARWKAWSESDWKQIEPTEEVHKYRGMFVRVMGDTASIQAAFYRAFAGPITSGIACGNSEEPFLVKRKRATERRGYGNQDKPKRAELPSDQSHRCRSVRKYLQRMETITICKEIKS